MTPTTKNNHSMERRKGKLGLPLPTLPAPTFRARFSRALARTAHPTNLILRKLPFLVMLGLLCSAGFGQSITERDDIEDFLQNIRPDRPSSAEPGLTLLDHHLSPDRRKLTVTLRNDHWKYVTAWSVSRTRGTSAGLGFIGTSGQDDFFEIAADPDAVGTGIAPGETVTHTIHFNESINLSPHRFDQGDFGTLILSPGAAIFSDGTFAGPDVKFLRNALASRYRYMEEAQALVHTLKKLRDDPAARSRYFAELASQEHLTLTERTLRHSYERALVNPTRDAPVAAINTAQTWLEGLLERGLSHLPSQFRESLISRRSR